MQSEVRCEEVCKNLLQSEEYTTSFKIFLLVDTACLNHPLCVTNQSVYKTELFVYFCTCPQYFLNLFTLYTRFPRTDIPQCTCVYTHSLKCVLIDGFFLLLCF